MIDTNCQRQKAKTGRKTVVSHWASVKLYVCPPRAREGIHTNCHQKPHAMKAGEGGKGGWEMSLTHKKSLESPSEPETRVTGNTVIAYGEKTYSNSN